ncbi:helix-turn-helix transcriptional regulator [Novosphingobium sp.]|uniref:helix-turn-helix transcriptional regulator n=1 Tax=Novosphingobium sp. TaxID=1874826 RepID=UPI0035669CF5
MPSNPDVPAKLAYSIKEVVHVTSLARSTVYNHIAKGRLKAVRIGGRTVVPAESLHALLAGDR